MKTHTIKQQFQIGTWVEVRHACFPCPAPAWLLERGASDAACGMEFGFRALGLVSCESATIEAMRRNLQTPTPFVVWMPRLRAGTLNPKHSVLCYGRPLVCKSPKGPQNKKLFEAGTGTPHAAQGPRASPDSRGVYIASGASKGGMEVGGLKDLHTYSRIPHLPSYHLRSTLTSGAFVPG